MIILGIDLGKARTGVAICDKGELLASPLTVAQEHNRERLVERLAAWPEHGAQRLAVGLPRNMDGSEGRAPNARDIAPCWRLPPAACGVRGRAGHHHHGPRLSERHQHPGQAPQSVVDAVAATVILQNYLDARRLRRSQE